MIRRSWSHLFSGTALLLLLAGSAAAELTGVAPGQTPGPGVGVAPANDAQDIAGSYLDRGNYEVVVGKRVVSASEVDWANVNPNAVSVRQRPGGGNALGNIKFMFPNQHSVYLHDTSSRGLFSQTYRALSHGCVRVHEPFAFADALLAEEPGGLDGKQLKGMIGGGEKYLWLKRKLEVHLAYFTA
ncbi:L,D-transpeptidase family protein, partial [Prosthecomicrobium hirschii]|uniref:L,D-transpeptidase family protein n=1 Tax=Prosthecodimorpha hirschii TaxID=665126 RepID=UPI00128ED3B4